MKKQLLTTTALVVAGALAVSGAALAQKKASKPTMTVGGYFTNIIGIVSDDLDDGRLDKDGINLNHIGVDVHNDGELFFTGRVQLDNGIKIRTRVEFETQAGTGPKNLVDEAYMTVSGAFGSLRIGSEDGAAHLLVTPYAGSWATNVGQNTNFDVQDWIDPPPGISKLNINRLDLGDGDSEKFSYFTPRIEGVQVGVTYMPSFKEGVDGQPSRNADAAHEGFAVAANYSRKLDKVGIGLAAGYATAHPAAGLDQSDLGGVQTGIRLKFGGFTGSVGWGREWSQTAETAAEATGVEEWNFGVKYVAGKDSFSVGYTHAEAEGKRSNKSKDELDQLLASYARALGPGVTLSFNFLYGDYDGEDVGSADDNEGFALTTMIKVVF